MGDTFFQRAKVEQWVDFAAHELEPARGCWMGPILGQCKFNDQYYQKAKKDVQTIMEVLNAHLMKHTFMVGNHVTLADIALVAALVDLYTTVRRAPSHRFRHTRTPGLAAARFFDGWPNVLDTALMCVQSHVLAYMCRCSPLRSSSLSRV
jgi:glutathione S-transferase